MANYHGEARTNYFRVIDQDKFEEALERIAGIEFVEKGDHHVAILFDDSIPSHDLHDDEIDWPALIAGHLAKDSVCIMMEVGAEKLRYLNGYTIAIHPNGKTIEISLMDIYQQAQEAFGDDVEITKAEY